MEVHAKCTFCKQGQKVVRHRRGRQVGGIEDYLEIKADTKKPCHRGGRY